MFKVVSPEWNVVIKSGFVSVESACTWAKDNCGESSNWDGIWSVEYYNPNPWVMTV